MYLPAVLYNFAASMWLHFLCPLTLLNWDINSRVNNNKLSFAYDQPLANILERTSSALLTIGSEVIMERTVLNKKPKYLQF